MLKKSINKKNYIIILFFILLFLSSNLFAQDIPISWNANTQPDLDHYTVYWGTSSGTVVDYPNNSGNIDKSLTAYTVTNLSDGITYYFAVKAFDNMGRASEYSAEICVASDSDNDGMPDNWETVNGLDPLINDSTGDLDADGLSNIDEYINTTKANDADTDNDGMLDGWEVQYGLDPLADDSSNDSDGDYFTNLQEYNGKTNPIDSNFAPPNNAPTSPANNYPLNNSEVASNYPVLSISNADDMDSQSLTYVFEIYADAGLSQLVASVTGLVEGNNTTEWQIDQALSDNTYYYWRVRAFDNIDYSSWTDTYKFFVNTFNDIPSVPNVSFPSYGSTVTTLVPSLKVTNSTDIDFDPVTYEYEVYADQNMITLITDIAGVIQGGGGVTSWTVNVQLSDNTSYWWRVQAMDNEGASSGWSDLSNFFINTSNNQPSIPSISFPLNNEEINTNQTVIEVFNSTDLDNDILTYFFEVDVVNTFDSVYLEKSYELSEGLGATSWYTPVLSDNTTWYWRVQAFDGITYSDWMTGSFFVNSVNDAPGIPVIKNPGDLSEVNILTPYLVVNPSTDMDNDTITYDFEIYSDSLLSKLVTSKTGASDSWQVGMNLTDNSTCYWRARAVDEHGAVSSWSDVGLFFVNTSNDMPTAPMLNNPQNNGFTLSLNPVLSVNNSTDPDYDTLTYGFELYSDQALLKLITSGTINEGNQITSFTVPVKLTDHTKYYWRVRANDGYLNSSWMSTAGFNVDTSGINFDINIIVSKEIISISNDTQMIKVTDNNLSLYGVCVEIPPKSINDDYTFTIGIVNNPPSLPENTISIGEAISFGPYSISFYSPATIIIPYSAEDMEKAGINDPAELEILAYNTETSSWVKLDISSVDTTNSTLIVKSDQFYPVYQKAITVDPLSGNNTVSNYANLSGGDGGGGSGCFIATAAFGSILEKHVQILCLFRDRFLLKNSIGTKFVKFYYKYSPPIADSLRKHPVARALVRYILIPITGIVYVLLNMHNFMLPVYCFIILIFLASLLLWFKKGRMRTFSQNN